MEQNEVVEKKQMWKIGGEGIKYSSVQTLTKGPVHIHGKVTHEKGWNKKPGMYVLHSVLQGIRVMQGAMWEIETKLRIED